MAEVLQLKWSGTSSGQTRRDRSGGTYEAYLPDRLVGRDFRLEGGVAADVSEAESAIARLNLEGVGLTNTEALARILLRAEAVASSRIEGLHIGARRLLRAEVAGNLDLPTTDVTARDVLANIDAMNHAVQTIGVNDDITPDVILATHRRLLRGTGLDAHAGRYRLIQNWIGGSAYNPCSAAFVPPPPDLVPTLMDDLCAFANSESVSPVVQAALVHAQFETIHPFVDGNGRIGRALIHLVLRRRGLAARVLPPISLILATWPKVYISGLTAFRHRGDPDSPESHAGLNEWVSAFADACTRSCADALAFEASVREIEARWREAVPTRRNSAADLLLSALLGAPVITATSAAALIGRSFKPASNAIERLVSGGVLKQVTMGRRNRAYEATEIISAFANLERRLSSPVGDTQLSQPARPVPRRTR